MKYIDADLLRAVIKEHTLFYAGQANLLDDTNTLDGYDEVLAIIDSLQQEQPEEPDKSLEEEARTYCRSSFKFDYDELNDSFNSHAFEFYDVVELARHFAEWQKEQMLKDAVEADVNTYKDLIAGCDWAEFVADMPINGLGDKVKLIIVKEDEK